MELDKLKQKFRDKTDLKRKQIKDLIASHGDKVIGQVTLSQIYQGMKGITALVSETSLLDANEGIRFRGYSIPDLQNKLPKEAGSQQPLPEALFYLMLFDEIPDADQAEMMTSYIQRRSHVPQHVFETISALPKSTHPMTQFVTGIMASQTQSRFAKAYAMGVHKKDYWSATFDDSIELIAKLPRIAAFIYRRKYNKGDDIQPDGLLDWSGNFAHMLGFSDPRFAELLRLYLTIHADHEGGNVSAHSTHLVASALSDPYLSYAAGMNGLAGPLHGLANQEVISWILNMQQELKTTKPTKNQIKEYVEKTLSEGKVVPGYGHAVLRKTDPRFTAQMEFAKQYMPNDDLCQTVWNIYEVVPPILGSLGKIKNPWPNVDAHSGALLMHFGLVEHDFYTVLFAVSRALGVMASLCWARALNFPIERPKSVTTQEILNFLDGKADAKIWGE